MADVKGDERKIEIAETDLFDEILQVLQTQRSRVEATFATCTLHYTGSRVSARG